MKRLIDLCFSLLLLAILSPIFIGISVLIWRNMGPPVFFKQLRPGLNGEPFYLYKFRTMNDERNKRGNLLSDMERLTKLGIILRNYSLDEIPQLINVLKGEMSLVGPRPLLMEYLPLYSEKHQARHRVRPGITGWSQINGRNAVTWKERLDMDVWYVNHRSLILDFSILIRTIFIVIKSEGVNQSMNDTMEDFKGLDE